MTYYVLTEKKERACPIGHMQGIVLDTFCENFKEVSYGLKPWYAGLSDGGRVFPGEMVLISQDKLIAYDIRASGAGPKFHIVSQGFLDLLRDFHVPIKEIQAIEIVNSKGRDIAEKKYYILVFSNNIYKDVDYALGEGSLLHSDESESTLYIKYLCFKDGFSEDFFKINDITAQQDPIFCSERFFRAAKGRGVVAGVNFRCVDEIDWASISPDNFLSFLADDREPLLFIH
ncbi:immunity protein 43 domain-containing protein [Ditylenchus destructor]|nr:immunity protein 43 domain-containing protein [Ditylenchus destructor]